MRIRGRKTHGREPHTLAGAYAMDAISEPDRARFERHLAGCEECAREIGLREATARLATATAVPPPSGLKERVLAAAALTRQQPPVSQAGAEAEAPRMAAIVSWFRARWPGRAGWPGRRPPWPRWPCSR